MMSIRRCWHWAASLIAALLFTSATFAASSVQLVRNINSVLQPQSSNPAALGSLNGKLLFGATDATGAGLWTTGGTTAGTALLQRLEGIGIVQGDTGNFLIAGSRAYFVSSSGMGSSAVWVTDGTSAGTLKVREFPSNTSARASLQGMLGASLIFVAYDASGTAQMFASDGTSAGTRALTSFSGQTAGIASGFIVVGSKFYFVAIGDQYAHQIWVSNGTAAGTHQVTNGLDTATSAAIYNPQAFQRVGNYVLYTSQGLLWRIDTTTDTLSQVLSVSDQGGLGTPEVLNTAGIADMGGFVLFLGSKFYQSPGFGLWRSDGTSAGTYQVADVTPSPTFDERQDPVFFQLGGRVIYIADDGVHGQQLWSSDGTAANTLALPSNSNSAAAPLQLAYPLLIVGGTAYLNMSDGVSPTTRTLWRTDGTVAGTKRLGGLPTFPGGIVTAAGDVDTVFFGFTEAGASASLYRYALASDSATKVASNLSLTNPGEFFDLGGLLLFSTNDPVLGNEPWVSDGTPSGTKILRDINPQVADAGSSPDEFVDFAGLLAFTADDGVTGRELWISDGTSGGTKLLADINPGAPGSYPNHLFSANGALYFFATDASGTSKFMRLASPDATVQTLASLSPLPVGSSSCTNVTGVGIGSQVFFAANDGASGLELWTSDGTAQGTHLTTDIAAGVLDALPCELTVMGSRVYFSAVGAQGSELWTSDGTAAGTLQVGDIAPGNASSSPYGFTVFNGRLYFSADDTAHGAELWASDGTSAGTRLVADIVPGPTGSYPYPRGILNGRLLLETYQLSPNANSETMQLWVTDGSSAGTSQVGTSSYTPYLEPFVNGNYAFFEANDSVGVQPWVTDGTAAGTQVLKQISAGGNYYVSWFEAFLGRTLFEATDASLGEQLWLTDGSTVGTNPIGTIPSQPGTNGIPNDIRHRLTVGNTFYFAANNPITGTELYALSHSAPTASDDTGTSTDDAAVTIDVLANDAATDAAIDPTSLQIVTGPAHGSAVIQTGKILYTPSTGYGGTDTFQYTIKDVQGVLSAPGTVSIAVMAPAATTPPATSQPAAHGGGGALSPVSLIGLLMLALSRFAHTGRALYPRPPESVRKVPSRRHAIKRLPN